MRAKGPSSLVAQSSVSRGLKVQPVGPAHDPLMRKRGKIHEKRVFPLALEPNRLVDCDPGLLGECQHSGEPLEPPHHVWLKGWQGDDTK